jgi:acetylornithine/N-succinyldiaminopimelate aminotransferase
MCWARDDVAEASVPGDHATTFGGQPLATAAARKVLEVMEREDVPRRARDAGKRLTDGLLGLPHLTDVRGLGLLLAAELEDRDGREVARDALGAGLVVNGISPTALRFAPSLLITDDEVDEALRILEEVLA